MSGPVHVVDVEIYGDRYSLKGTEPPEYLEMLAAMVNEKMKEVALRNNRLNLKQIAVLAALHLADELVKLKREHRELLSLLDETEKR